MATSQPKPSRRLRYSLRTVLILMLAAGLFFAWFTPRMRRSRDQGAAIEALIEAEQSITFTYEQELTENAGTVAVEPLGPAWAREWLGDGFFQAVVAVDWKLGRSSYTWEPLANPTVAQLSRLSTFRELRELTISAPIPDEGLVPIGTLTRLERLTLSGERWGRGPATPFGDEGVAHLSRLKRLKQLAIDSPAVTGASFDQLSGLASIETLTLNWSGITDDGLAHLRGATSLRELNLSRTAISDVGVTHFPSLVNLRVLDLSHTAVTDESLIVLAALTGLQEIDATGTHVTTAGMLQFERALPRCRVAPLDDWRDTIRKISRHDIDGRVQLFRSLFTTDQLPVLADMPKVRQLCIDRIAIDDNALAAVASLPNLQQLVLWHAPVTGDDLSELASNSNLTGIAITGKYSPAAIESLAKVPQLRQFVYAPTAEDDLSIAHIKAVLDVLPKLTQLERIVLGGPLIDQRAVENVQAAIPTVRVDAMPRDVTVPHIWAVLTDQSLATTND